MRTTVKFHLEHIFHNVILTCIIAADRMKRSLRRSPPRSFWDL